MGRVLAAVDIGSNTVHLLVAEAWDNAVRKISDQSSWLGLGQVVGKSKVIPLHLQDELIRTLSGYRETAAYERAEQMYVFATEAVRVAANGRAVLERVHRETGLRVEIVDGETEAEFGARGASIDCGEWQEFTLVEVGGGSAQVAAVENGHVTSDISLPLGTGALTAKFGIHCPCELEEVEELQAGIRAELKRLPSGLGGQQVVACGGVARGIWKSLHPDGDRMMAVPELEHLIWTTQRLTTEVICSRFRVKQQRAATLLPGAIVYREVLNHLDRESFVVSRYGVREGAILALLEGGLTACQP